MPFAALERPALGISLLQARLRDEGVPCDIRYLSFVFADYVGLEDYLWIHGGLPYTAFAGDWAFSRSLNGDRPAADAAYVEHVLRGTWRLDEGSISRVLGIRAYCEHFLDYCMSAIPWSSYDVIGFTSTFEQNIASLALARRVKAAHPDLQVVFGGANWEGEMGAVLHERFPFVDIVCSGEADHSFPAVLRCLRDGVDPGGVRGIVYRKGGRSITTGPAVMVGDMDGLSLPDFDDFVRDQRASPSASELIPLLLIETSRGCWWGAKQHCTFCGLNGGTMAFRSKSAERVVQEIRFLKERHGIEALSVVDNILDMRYFATLLPLLVEQRLNLNLFYEVKANLTLAQVRTLAAAGVRRIQPGIESFSDHVLDLMRKGTTALQNIQLLKWCKEFGVRPEWNLLYGFPGEDPRDYAEMIPLVLCVDFLDPPGAYGPIRLDRFSPYHADPAGYDMENVRPMQPYQYLYPFEHHELMRVAYYFDFDYSDGRDPLDYARPLLAVVQAWQDRGPQGGLWMCKGPEGSVIVIDERSGAPRSTVRLEGWHARAYEACDRTHTPRRLLDMVDLAGVSATDLNAFLDWCLQRRFMVTRGGRYLALAVHRPARTEPSPHEATSAASGLTPDTTLVSAR